LSVIGVEVKFDWCRDKDGTERGSIKREEEWTKNRTLGDASE